MPRARQRNAGPEIHPRRSKRPFIVLDDQGPPVSLSPDDFGLPGRDRTWNLHADGFRRANEAPLRALEVQAELHPTRDEVGLRLRPGGSVGAVPLHAPDTRKVAGGLVVRPRFGWNGIGLLLHHIGWSASPQLLRMSLVPGSAREVPPWVLAGPILTRFDDLLQEMRRGFRVCEETRQTPRGTILWPRYASEQVVRGALHRFPCRFPELGVDALLCSYLRWGLERVYISLAPFIVADVIARQLADQAQILIQQVKDQPSRLPARRTLQQMLHGTGLPSSALLHGLEALGWLVDERGLGGRAEMDGLSWRLVMSEIFEKWLAHLAVRWAKTVGGQVRTGHRGHTQVPIEWTRRGAASLSSLVPDLVVTVRDHLLIFDAKYKGHFEEMDEARWAQQGEELRAEHRHDVHQVLAYASLFEARAITAVLAYPMQADTWLRLAQRGHTAFTASLAGGGRSLRLALLGIPLQVAQDQTPEAIVQAWSSLL